MPVIMRTSYTGSGDTFRFFEDGRPLSGAENYDYVDERDLTPDQVRALEELSNSVKQAAPKDVWSGELGNSAGAPAPPADPALATRPQRVPPEGDAPPPAPPVPPMGAGPGMSPISGPMPTGAPAAPPPDNPAQQWNPSYAPPDTQGPQAMRRAGTPWGEMRYHAPPFIEADPMAVAMARPTSPLELIGGMFGGGQPP